MKIKPVSSVNNSKESYRLSIDATQYHKNPFPGAENSLQRVISYRDDTNPVQMDSARVMRVFHAIRSKDFKYYFYILAKLERNDKAVFVSFHDMRVVLGDKTVSSVKSGIATLVREGLLIVPENTRGRYIVNPVYAWKGNRLDYLDLSTFDDKT